MFLNVLSTLPSSTNGQKSFMMIFRTFQEQAYHNQMDDGGKHGYQNWRGYEGSSKTFMWQLLDGKYDSIIV